MVLDFKVKSSFLYKNLRKTNKILLSIFLIALILNGCMPFKKDKPIRQAPEIRVLLDQIDDSGKISFLGTYVLDSEEAQYDFGKNNDHILIKVLPDGYKLFNDKRIFVFRKADKIVLTPVDTDDTFLINNNEYSGSIILQLSEKGKLLVINSLNLESYLKSVVPAEMPSKSDSNMEALKAQSICARTYALNRMDERKGTYFDVYRDVRDQVYKGLDVRTKNADQAVDQTYADVLMSEKGLVKVYYHSTCGGVLEPVSTLAKNNIVKTDPEKDIIGTEFTCSISPYFRWERSFSFEEVDSLLGTVGASLISEKEVSDTTEAQLKISVSKRALSGRVTELELVSADTTIHLKDYEIRRFFQDQNDHGLPSTLFVLQSSSDSMLTFQGGGYGHGVGLCQWGAIKMSKDGFKYFDILINKYFKNSFLKKAY